MNNHCYAVSYVYVREYCPVCGNWWSNMASPIGLGNIVTLYDMSNQPCPRCFDVLDDYDHILNDDDFADEWHGPYCTCEICIQDYPEREIYLVNEGGE